MKARIIAALAAIIAVTLSVIALVGVAPAQATNIYSSPGGDRSWYLTTSTGAPVTFYAYVDAKDAGGSLDIRGTYRDRVDCASSSSFVDLTVAAPDGTTQTSHYNVNQGSCAATTLTGWTGLTSAVAGVWTITMAGDGNGDVQLVMDPRLNGQAKPGRVWTDRLITNQRGAVGVDTNARQHPVEFTLFTLGPDGIQHTLRLPSFNGFNSDWQVNNIGYTSDGCTPVYHSVTWGAGARAASPSCPGFVRYRLFLEPPDPGMPTTTVPSADGPTWAYAAYRPSKAEVAIVSATGYSPGRAPVAGTVTVANSGDVTGKVSVWIDGNGDGDHDDPVDGLLFETGQLNPGETASGAWDGRDARGGALGATGWTLLAELGSVGEVHFINSDAEWRSKGAEIIQTAGPLAGTPDADLVWWNDDDAYGMGPFCVSTSDAGHISCDWSDVPDFTPKKVGPAGVHSTGGTQHAWGLLRSDGFPSGADNVWGNYREIDDWQRFDFAAATGLFPEPVHLSATKTDGRTTVAPKDQLTYTIAVTADASQTGVVIADALPANVTFVSASDAGVLSSGKVTWPAVDMADGATVTRTVTVNVNADVRNGVTVDNFAYAYPALDRDGQPATPLPCDATVQLGACARDTDTVAFPVLSVAKDDGVKVAKPGDRLTYAITIRNDGAAVAKQVKVVDALPANVTFVSATDGGLADGAVVTWPATDVAAGTALVRRVTVTVDAGVPRPSTLTNLATVKPVAPGDALPPSCASGDALCATDVDQVPEPTLTTTKTDSVTQAQPGDTLTYTIQSTNAGPGVAVNAVVYDLLPEHVTFVSASDGGTVDGRMVTWPGVPLGVGASLSRTVTVTVDEDIPRPAELRNLATTIDRPTPGDPPSCAKGCAEDTDLVPAPGLSITKTDGVTTARPGDTLRYVLRVANTGAGDAVNLHVVDNLPEHVTLVGVEAGAPAPAAPLPEPSAEGTSAAGGDSPGTGSVAAPSAAGDAGALGAPSEAGGGTPAAEPVETAGPVGTAAPVGTAGPIGTAAPMKVGEPAGTSVAPTADTPTPSPVSAESATGADTPAADLAGTTPAADGSPESVAPAEEFPATDPAPSLAEETARLTWTPLRDYSVDGRMVTLKPSRLNHEQVAYYRVVVTVDTDIPRPTNLTNVATVAEGSAHPDCDADIQHCARDVDEVPSFDVRIDKEIVRVAFTKGGTAEWTLRVANFGTGTARQVVVQDLLPSQLDAASVEWGVPTVGAIADGRWLVGDLPPGIIAEVSVTGTIANALAPRDLLVSTAWVTTPDDPGKGMMAGRADSACQVNDGLDADTDGCDRATSKPPAAPVAHCATGKCAAGPARVSGRPRVLTGGTVLPSSAPWWLFAGALAVLAAATGVLRLSVRRRS